MLLLFHILFWIARYQIICSPAETEHHEHQAGYEDSRVQGAVAAAEISERFEPSGLVPEHHSYRPPLASV